MYNNPYSYGNYNGFYAPPMPDQLAQLRQQQAMNSQQTAQQQVAQPAQQPTAGINWVQGEEGARAWLVNPSTTVMLMDSDGSSFYLKSADASGMPQPLRVFDYVERVQPQKAPVQAAQNETIDYVTREELNALAARVDALSTTSKSKKVAKEDAE